MNKADNLPMSASEFLHKIYFEKRKNTKAGEFYPEPVTTEKIKECEAYSNYLLSHHINVLAERIAEKAQLNDDCNNWNCQGMSINKNSIR